MFDFSDHVDVNMKATKLLTVVLQLFPPRSSWIIKKIYLNYKKSYKKYWKNYATTKNKWFFFFNKEKMGS